VEAHLTADYVVSAEKTAAQLPPVAADAVAAGTLFLHFEEVSKEEGNHRSLSTHEADEGRSFDYEWVRLSLTGRLWQRREQKVVEAAVETAADDVVQ
jgi:hypothetical protein